MAEKHMKRVAIIGCSHSDDCGCDSGNDYVWVKQMADANPHIEFHNYSKVGHGSLYFDMVLKHLVTEGLEYDKVILQWTGGSRWMDPVQAENWYVDYTPRLKYPPPPHFIEMPWHRDNEVKNLKRFRLTWPRKGVMDSLPLSENDTYYGGENSDIMQYKQKDNSQYNPAFGGLSVAYTDLMIDSLKIYRNFYDIFSFCVLSSALDNQKRIKHGIPCFQSSCSDEEFVNMLDDTLHLTQYGNTRLWDWLKLNGLTLPN